MFERKSVVGSILMALTSNRAERLVFVVTYLIGLSSAFFANSVSLVLPSNATVS